MSRVQTILKFIGGINKDRIGGNCSLIEHTAEKGNTKRVMFDLGSKFTPSGSEFSAAYPNVDEYFDRVDLKSGELIKASKPVDFLFLTHAHEDHIGALINYTKMGYRLPRMKAGGFTRNFVRLIFAKEGLIVPEIERIQAGDIVKVGDSMEIEAVDVSHSIVDSLGFHTLTYANGRPYAAIMNNGDFLTEENMPLGKSFSLEQYLDVFKRKPAPTTVVCLDSTSTVPNGKERIGFAKAVENTYDVVMENRDKSLIISPVISRSVQNMAIDIETARKLGTKVFLDGKWLQTVKDAMILSGYKDFEDVVYKGSLQSYLYDKHISQKYIICTGAFAQGMEDYDNNIGMSAYSPIAMSSAVKMALDLHPQIKIGKDTLILSRQRIINEINGKSGPKMLQLMAKKGATVVMSPSEKKVGGFKEVQMQDSGHANAQAMEDLLAEVKKVTPEVIAVPIHGNEQQCENTKAIMDKIEVKTHLTQNQGILSLEDGNIKDMAGNGKPLTWYAIKMFIPQTDNISRSLADMVTEVWEISDNYEPIRKIGELQSEKVEAPKPRYDNYKKGIEEAEELPYREKMKKPDKKKTAQRQKAIKASKRYNLNKRFNNRSR